MANNTTKNGVYVPSILVQKFRGKGPQNAGNGISGCLDLKIFRGRMPPVPPTNARFFTRHRSKKTLDPPLAENVYNCIQNAICSDRMSTEPKHPSKLRTLVIIYIMIYSRYIPKDLMYSKWPYQELFSSLV